MCEAIGAQAPGTGPAAEAARLRERVAQLEGDLASETAWADEYHRQWQAALVRVAAAEAEAENVHIWIAECEELRARVAALEAAAREYRAAAQAYYRALWSSKTVRERGVEADRVCAADAALDAALLPAPAPRDPAPAIAVLDSFTAGDAAEQRATYAALAHAAEPPYWCRCGHPRRLHYANIASEENCDPFCHTAGCTCDGFDAMPAPASEPPPVAVDREALGRIWWDAYIACRMGPDEGVPWDEFEESLRPAIMDGAEAVARAVLSAPRVEPPATEPSAYAAWRQEHLDTIKRDYPVTWALVEVCREYADFPVVETRDKLRAALAALDALSPATLPAPAACDGDRHTGPFVDTLNSGVVFCQECQRTVRVSEAPRA